MAQFKHAWDMTQELPSGRLQPRVMQEVTPDKPSGSLWSENTKTAGGGKRTTGFFLASPGAAASTGQSCAEQRREHPQAAPGMPGRWLGRSRRPASKDTVRRGKHLWGHSHPLRSQRCQRGAKGMSQAQKVHSFDSCSLL